MRKLIAIIMVLSTWLGFSGEFSKIELKDFKGKKFTLKNMKEKNIYKTLGFLVPCLSIFITRICKIKKRSKRF